MKKVILIMLLFISSGVSAQNKSVVYNAPARGHYKQLESFSSKPVKIEVIDTLRFPFDAAVAEKRISLKPFFLTHITLSDFTLPDVPANSSELTRAELNYLLRLQEQRTELDVQTSLEMAGIYYKLSTIPGDEDYALYRKNLFFIGRSIGTWFNHRNLPLTADLMANVWQDASYFIWSFKYKYARVRPHVLEPDLNYLEETNWAAYPSGHAANSYINAYIYAALAPEFSGVFLKDAYDMAHSREIIGVHYPSDSETSRLLAQQLVSKLFANKEFILAFEKVKTEWAEKAKENFQRPFRGAKRECTTPATSCTKKCD